MANDEDCKHFGTNVNVMRNPAKQNGKSGTNPTSVPG
jgi:hypothetical protein